MTTYTTAIAWADAAAHGTRTERSLIAAAALLTRVAARSARLRSERAEVGESWADRQRELLRADAVRMGLLRR